MNRSNPSLGKLLLLVVVVCCAHVNANYHTTKVRRAKLFIVKIFPC